MQYISKGNFFNTKMFVFGKFRTLLKTDMFVIGTQRVNIHEIMLNY